MVIFVNQELNFNDKKFTGSNEKGTIIRIWIGEWNKVTINLFFASQKTSSLSGNLEPHFVH